MPEEVSEEGINVNDINDDKYGTQNSQQKLSNDDQQLPSNGNSSPSSPQTNQNGVAKLLKKVKNPAMTDNIRTYNEISSTFSSLHNNQALFMDSPNADLLSPIL